MSNKKISKLQINEILVRNNIDISGEKFNIDDILKGTYVEFEHGTERASTNITDDNLEMTVKIALAHLYELHDYYDRLEIMESFPLKWILLIIVILIFIVYMYVLYPSVIDTIINKETTQLDH